MNVKLLHTRLGDKVCGTIHPTNEKFEGYVIAHCDLGGALISCDATTPTRYRLHDKMFCALCSYHLRPDIEYGRWVNDLNLICTVLEEKVLSKQKCSICGLAAPHIPDTTNYLCNICNTLKDLLGESDV